MQKKNGNVGTMLESLAKLEADVRALRREVSTLVSRSSKRTAARAKRPAFKSLRGIFPASDIAWEDFRDARASWTRNLAANLQIFDRLIAAATPEENRSASPKASFRRKPESRQRAQGLDACHRRIWMPANYMPA